MKKSFTMVAAFVLALSGIVFACDGWRQIEKKNKRYDRIDLTADQKKQINSLRDKAVAQFSDDHNKPGGCDHYHHQTVGKFVSDADGVLTNVQRMELRTGEKIERLEGEVKMLRKEIAELKALVKSLKK